MPRATSQRAGRKNNNERIRELIALLGSLSRTGDTVSIDAISSRLGISADEARAMMDIVCQASGEELGGLLISSNDEETEYTLQFPGTTGRPIRLTSAETIALIHALDVAGIDEDDPIRDRLRVAFSSPDVAVKEVRQALGSARAHQEALLLSAQSQVEQRSLVIWYQGLQDNAPRRRRIVVKRMMTEGDSWYVIATDLDIEQERTFRVDRMSSVELGNTVAGCTGVEPTVAQYVRITFLNKTYYYAFDWPKLHVLREDDSCILGTIPYYGERSTWLIRRICAGNGSITVDDERIMQLAREYARRLLDE